MWPCNVKYNQKKTNKQKKITTATATAKKKTVQNNLRTWKDKKEIRFLPVVSYDADEVRNLRHPLCCKASQQLHGFSDRRWILT